MITGTDVSGKVNRKRRHLGWVGRPAAPSSLRPGPASFPIRAVPVRARWESRYAMAVATVDLLAFACSVALRSLWGEAPAFAPGSVMLTVVTLSLVATFLASVKAWEPTVLGQGSQEVSRLLRATVTSAVVLGLVGLAFKASEVRPWVFGVIPVGGALAGIGRLVARRWLHRRRRSGCCLRQVLVIGGEDAVTELIDRTLRAPHHGWVVTGACTPTGTGTDGGGSVQGVTVVGDLDCALGAARSGRYRIVSVAQGPGWSSTRLHHLAWELEGSGVELVVHPGLMDGAGPRLHVDTVDGLPLLKLTEPVFVGVPRVVKTTMDRVGAALLVFVLAPLLAAVAVAIRLDGGPALFRQVRVGLHGEQFRMLKFRSMVVDAESRRTALTDLDEGAGPLFKMRRDPRVTAVGAWLRRYSLDELPQLLNVLGGSMSLVGPRPPLPCEVETYAPDARRKLLVRPGLTGLWQISGRSDLSWEESVRLDLRYVENWNLALDTMILWKTIGAVVRGRGAY